MSENPIRRLPVLSYVAVIGLIAMHWHLCYPASSQRGYPYIDPLWEYVIPYLCIFIPVLIQLFDDRKLHRWILRGLTTVGLCLGLGAVYANMMSAVPRAFPGLVHIVYYAGLILPIVFVWVVCLDRLAAGVWKHLRKFK